MPRIPASSAYSFHQPLASWLWSPAGCILNSVFGPWGSSGVLFFWLFFSFFLFLCLWSSFSSCGLSSFSCCSCSSSYLLLSFSPSFISSSCHLPPFSCLSSRSSRFFLGSSCHLLSSNCLPVPPVTLLSLSVTFLLSSVISFFLAFRILLSLFFRRLPFAVYRRLLPFFPVVSSCYFFRPSPPGQSQLSSPVLSFLSSLSLLLSYPWCLPPPSFSLLFLCFFSCSSCLLFVVYDFYF